MKKIFLIAVLLGLGAVMAFAQGQTPNAQGPEQHMPPGRQGLLGKVTAVGKDSLTVVPVAMGNAGEPPQGPVTVRITENTRIAKQREPIKLGDIKVDDIVFAAGPREGDTVQALRVGVIPQELAERIRSGQGGMMMTFGGPGGMGPAQFNREDLGKKFIAGTVKAINETKLTIARTDGQTQEIEVDENTSFRKGRESVTLPDIKAGDFVFGRGELKNNVFVPQVLNVGRAQMRMMAPGPGDGTPSQKPETEKPAKEAPPKN